MDRGIISGHCEGRLAILIEVRDKCRALRRNETREIALQRAVTVSQQQRLPGECVDFAVSIKVTKDGSTKVCEIDEVAGFECDSSASGSQQNVQKWPFLKHQIRDTITVHVAHRDSPPLPAICVVAPNEPSPLPGRMNAAS